MEITGPRRKDKQLGSYAYNSQWSRTHYGDVITVI